MWRVLSLVNTVGGAMIIGASPEDWVGWAVCFVGLFSVVPRVISHE